MTDTRLLLEKMTNRCEHFVQLNEAYQTVIKHLDTVCTQQRNTIEILTHQVAELERCQSPSDLSPGYPKATPPF